MKVNFAGKYFFKKIKYLPPKGLINIDYFMVDECVRFLSTSCERLLTNE